MTRRIGAGALAAPALVTLSTLLAAGPAAACNSIDGCMHAAQQENYGMMHDGRMSAAMRSGAANVEAFRSMGPATGRQGPPAGKRPGDFSAR